MSTKTDLNAIHAARATFRDVCAMPVSRLPCMPPLKAAQTAWEIPVELAAHGFTVELVQRDDWEITITVEIGSKAVSAHARAPSLLAALREAVKAFEARLLQVEVKLEDEQHHKAA